MAALLLQVRRQHPTWGPAKLLHYLAPRHPAVERWPAVSTTVDLLHRHGLVAHRRRRRPEVHPGTVPLHTTAPNDLRTADFKGEFRTRDVSCRGARYWRRHHQRQRGVSNAHELLS